MKSKYTKKTVLDMSGMDMLRLKKKDLIEATRVLADVARKRFKRMEESEYSTYEHELLKKKLEKEGKIYIDSAGNVLYNKPIFETKGKTFNQLRRVFKEAKRYLQGMSTITEAKIALDATMKRINETSSRDLWVYDVKTKTYRDPRTGAAINATSITSRIYRAVAKAREANPGIFEQLAGSEQVILETTEIILQDKNMTADELADALEKRADQLYKEQQERDAEMEERFKNAVFF